MKALGAFDHEAIQATPYPEPRQGILQQNNCLKK